MKTITFGRGMSDAELARWTKRLALLLVVGTIAFAAFYVIDRWRPPAPAMVDQHIAALEQAVRDNPNDIPTRGQLADAYSTKGRFEDAVAQYDVIIDAGVALELAHLGRGRALEALGRLDEAIVDYDAVAAIASEGEMAHVDLTLQAAYYGLGSIAIQQGRAADAIVHLEKALTISRSDADALYLLGTAFIATGQAEQAVTVLRASIAFVPIGWSEPYAALAEAYGAAGQADLAAWAGAMVALTSQTASGLAQAETALTALVDGAAGLDATIGLGLLYETRGDNARAAEWYSKALAMAPGNSAAQLGLSRVGPIPTSGGGSGS